MFDVLHDLIGTRLRQFWRSKYGSVQGMHTVFLRPRSSLGFEESAVPMIADDGDDIEAVRKTAHQLDVQFLQAIGYPQ